MLPLTDGSAHLWLLELTALPPSFEEQCRRILVPEERERADRFRVDGARLQFCAGRALCRMLLGRHTQVAPEAWRFETNPQGRPHAVAPDGSLGPPFNVSHTDGLVACVFGATSEIGVDVEHLNRRIPLDIADSFFAPSEVRALRQLPADAQYSRFLELWTLKESYIKARGLGLSLALDCFWFDLDQSRVISESAEAASDVRLGMDTRANDTPAAWQFRHWRHGGTHMVAVAARASTSLHVHVHRISSF